MLHTKFKGEYVCVEASRAFKETHYQLCVTDVWLQEFAAGRVGAVNPFGIREASQKDQTSQA